MKQTIIFLLVGFFSVVAANAQMNIGSSQAPDSSAMLQISGKKGFLPPRVSNVEMRSISTPALGLVVFNTTDSALYMRRDSGWVKIVSDGFVKNVAVANANGLSGSVDNSGDSQSITLNTTVSGMIKGNGTALSAASAGTDYSAGTSGNATGIVKSTNGTGALTTAVASDFPTFNQNTTGTASNITGVLTASSFPRLTGDVTTTTGSLATTITAKAVTNAKMANMAANTFKANSTASAASPTDITGTQATALLDVFGTAKGLVPGTTSNTTSFLRADGAFAVPPGTNTNNGTVTSASVVTANGLAGTVATASSTPAITLSTNVNGMVKANGTAFSAASAGTDYSAGTSGNTTGIVKSTNGTGALTTAVASDFPTLNQNTTGTAANITGVLNATSHPALTGDVTTASGSVATTISNSAVTNAKMANMAANTFKANSTASAASPTDITGTQATALLDVFGTAKGLVPGTTSNTTSFLRADGAFAVPPGTNTNNGTVTSASVVTANGLAGTVATASSTPAITLSTTVNGIAKGDGTSFSAASAGTDYSAGTSGNATGIVKSTNGTGALTTAVASDFPTLNQNTTGTAANITGVLNATSLPALTGDVTSTAGSSTTTISTGVVTNTKLATMATQTFKGRTTAGTGAPEDLTATQATAILNVFGTAKGLVPGTTSNTTSFLRADGTFAVPAGTGLSSLNGLTGQTQTFATGTGGNDFNVVSSGTAHTFNLPDASASARGAVTINAQTFAGSKTFSSAPTFSSITAGSIPFAGTGGLISQNNASLFWDATNNRLGIGINTPASALHVSGTNPLTLNGVVLGTNTSADSILTISSGVVKKLPVSTFAVQGSDWLTTGNAGTTAGTNYIGTSDANDLVLKANATERLRIVNGTSTETGTTGDIKIGDATSGTVRSAKELVMREDGDVYGSSALKLRNRDAENGAIFENIGASSGAYLVDFIYRTGASQASYKSSNIRFETRSGSSSMKLTGSVTEWQFGQPDALNGGPTLVVGASGTGSNSAILIGNFGIGTTTPSASLNIRAGTATAGTAPIKLTSGAVMTTPESGAVEFDGTNYFATSGTARYTLAKTLTSTGSLAFGSTAANTSSSPTTVNGTAGSTITVTGAAVGDVVVLGIPSADGTINGSFTAFVSAANAVTVRYHNNTTAAITPTTGTFRVSVLKY